MALSRSARQRRGTPRRAYTHHSGVDAFGTLKTDEGTERVRLIEYAQNKFAAFRDGSRDTPELFEAETYKVHGRIFTATTLDGAEVKFQKAGCGCETPQGLRGSKIKLLEDGGLGQKEESA